MSFFRKKSALEIPPADNAARNELLGSRGSGRSVSPQPPPYRPSDTASYNTSRDGDKYDNVEAPRQPSYDSTRNGGPARGPVPERYANRGAAGDPYARGGDADAARAALFGGYDAGKQRAASGGPNRFADPAQDNEPRQFQTQEEEEEEVEGIKAQTRWVKQESVQSSRNALRIAREAEETGRNALLRLGDQSEKLANTERYVDQGKLHALRAEDRTDELKKLNRSIFRPAITFNKDKKRAAQEAKVATRYDEERANRERAMADVRDSHNRLGQAAFGTSLADEVEDGFGEEGIGRRPNRFPEQQRHRQETRKRYQFEKTASDDELEDELDDNFDEIAQVTKSLKKIAIAAGEELDRQNDRIDNISTKTGKLDTRVGLTTDRLRRIK